MRCDSCGCGGGEVEGGRKKERKRQRTGKEQLKAEVETKSKRREGKEQTLRGVVLPMIKQSRAGQGRARQLVFLASQVNMG